MSSWLTPEIRSEVEGSVGHSFSNPDLIELALTHSSLADQRTDSNERMEFFGDSLLGFVVCEHLFNRYPDASEGELTKIKSYLVSRLMCADYANEAGFLHLLALGKGFPSGVELPKSVAAAAFEAMIAAIFIDAGFEKARDFILRFVEPHVESTERMGHQMNFKSVLQQIVQANSFPPPTYIIISEKGPDHSKSFEVCVEIGLRRFSACWGLSKKVAEQAAALTALRELGHARGEPPFIEVVWRLDPTETAGNQRAICDAIDSATQAGSPPAESTSEWASDA